MRNLFILILLTFTVLSQVPSTISYQGQLLDNFGNPVPNGNITATFSLHDADEAGNQVWFEEQSFSTNDGIFNVDLGSVQPITSLDFDSPLWLEILIEGDNTALSPRIELTANPFSRNVATVVGGSINNSTIGNISPSGGTFTTIEAIGNSISATSATLSINSIDLGTNTIYIPNSVGNGTVLTSDGSGNATWESLPAGVSLGGDETITGNWVNEDHPWVDNEVDDALTISGGTVENTPIGATTPSGGTFTSLRLSTGASDGHVLTADANGNATWQAASGGGGDANNLGYQSYSLSGTQNALDPNGAGVVYINATGDLTINGIDASGASDGDIIILLIESNGNTIDLTLNSGSASVGNRLFTGTGSISSNNDIQFTFAYSSDFNKWIRISVGQGAFN